MENGVGSALLEYAQGTGDWDAVVTAFVDGWKTEYDASTCGIIQLHKSPAPKIGMQVNKEDHNQRAGYVPALSLHARDFLHSVQ